MTDKEKSAYWKGYDDSKKENVSVLTEVLQGGRFEPPSENKEAYKAGWGRGKREK